MKKKRKRTPNPFDFKARRRAVLRVFEVEFVFDLLQHAAGNVSEAARLAGIDRKHLWRLMRRTGIHVEVGS